MYGECEYQSPPWVTDKLILEGFEHPQSTKWISAYVAYDWPSPDYDNFIIIISAIQF
jgi:hypothetical protein